MNCYLHTKEIIAKVLVNLVRTHTLPSVKICLATARLESAISETS